MVDAVVRVTGYSSIPDSEAERRLFASVRAETRPTGAMVLSDLSGKYFRWACRLCGTEGVTRLSKERAQGEAARHNQNWHVE